jgi:hypothetical protein
LAGSSSLGVASRESAASRLLKIVSEANGFSMKSARVHLASFPSRNVPAYQRFGADANRARGLGMADHHLLGRNPRLSPDPRMVTSAAVPE